MGRRLYVPLVVDFFDDEDLIAACKVSPWCEVLHVRCCALVKRRRLHGVVTSEVLADARVPGRLRLAQVLVEHGVWAEANGQIRIRGWGTSVNGSTWRRSLPSAIRRLVLTTSNGMCHWCGGPAEPHPEIDHVVAVRLGGTDEPDNLVLACQACNRRKGSLSLDEWAARSSA